MATLNEETRSLALRLALLDPIAGMLNASLVLFPHVAILAFMGASGAWWGVLAFLVVLLHGVRYERRKVTDKLVTLVTQPTPAPKPQQQQEDKQP